MLSAIQSLGRHAEGQGGEDVFLAADASGSSTAALRVVVAAFGGECAAGDESKDECSDKASLGGGSEQTARDARRARGGGGLLRHPLGSIPIRHVQFLLATRLTE